MKELIIEPTIASADVVVQFSDTMPIDKSLVVKVPNTYQAIVYIDGKPQIRIPVSEGKRLFDYGKEVLGKKCRIAFVKSGVVGQMAWGFGNISIKDSKLNIAYKVGANGKYFVEIAEPGKLLKQFDGQHSVRMEDLRDCTINIIKSSGVSILCQLFAELSVFDAMSKTDELRFRLIDSLQKQNAFSDVGLQLHNLTVDGIFIPEADLDAIKASLNKLQLESNSAPDHDATLLEIFAKLQTFEKRLQSVDTAQKKDEKKDLEALKKEVERIVADQLAESASDIKDSIQSEISKKVSIETKLWQESLLCALDEKLQDYSESSKDVEAHTDLSAESLINQGDEGILLAAGKIYTGIENNLINTFKLKHINKKYIIPYDEYVKLANETVIDGEYVLQRKTGAGQYELLPVQVYEVGENSAPKTVEMLPIVRYLKAGLSPEDAKYAADISFILNKVRHPSPENKATLNRFLSVKKIALKEYLLNALVFLKAKNLYSE